MNEAIVFDHVDFEYDPNEPVIRDLSLTICEGEFIAVLGHNGSGKSTLANLINAILVPTCGKVTVFGMDTADEKLTNEIRKNAGMVFQNPDNQIVATSVEEDTAFAPENLGVPPAEIRKRVDTALDEVGMREYADRPPYKLSGGQKQRVAIAGILAMNPKILILDEPTAMLDPKGRKEVMTTIKRLNASGITVVFVTHYMDEAAKANRVLVMDRGVLVRDCPPRTLFSEADFLRGLGLDIPPAAKLAEELKKSGLPIQKTVLNATECAEEITALIGGKKWR